MINAYGPFIGIFATQKDVTGLVVHSDQGFQYTSHAYHDMLYDFTTEDKN
ncbi:hypothetical protein [Paenibacillus sp.]|nr:hypothetical protein [Paenibacillus sp.]